MKSCFVLQRHCTTLFGHIGLWCSEGDCFMDRTFPNSPLHLFVDTSHIPERFGGFPEPVKYNTITHAETEARANRELYKYYHALLPFVGSPDFSKSPEKPTEDICKSHCEKPDYQSGGALRADLSAYHRLRGKPNGASGLCASPGSPKSKFTFVQRIRIWLTYNYIYNTTLFQLRLSVGPRYLCIIEAYTILVG